MILKSTSKIALSFWEINIYWYGIIMTISIITASYFIYKFLKMEKDITLDEFSDFTIWLIAGGIIGARLYYVAFDFSYFQHNLLEIIQIYKGGLSIHGALIGGALSYFIQTKFNPKFNGSLDIIAIFLPLAQTLGRWGNFFNNEAYGKPTEGFIKLFIPENIRPLEYINCQYFHPTFLYESILNFIIFCSLLFLYKQHKNKLTGLFPYIYLALYSIVRFIIEPIRIDSIYFILGIPLAQFISICIFIFSAVMIFYKARKN